MILFSPIDNVASSNGIADGFGLQIGSEWISTKNYRKIAVVEIVNGQPIVRKAFYNNNGDNTFFEYGNSANNFTLTPEATVYVSYVVASRTLQLGTATNTPFFSQTVANASDLWVTLQRPVRLSLGGYALGATKPLSASIDNVYLQQGVRSYRPTGCSAADGISTTGIALTWNAAASATSYNIYRSAADGLAYFIKNTTSTSYTDVPSSGNTLVAGVNYTYVVRAVSTAGDSESSNADVGWFNIEPATGLSATDGTLTTGVKLTWTAPTAPSAIIGYRVMRAIGSAAASEIGTSGVTNYLDTTAVAGTLYTYSIIATTSAGDSLTASNTNTGWRFIGVPTIKKVSPTSGTTLGGTAFIITGTNLTGATSVTVGGVAATSVVVVSATSITAQTPAGSVGAKSVAVTTASGTATKASAFKYVVPVPTITSIAPTSGTTLGGTTFTITGTNLTGATRVKVNGVAATNVVVVSATSITAKTPKGTAGAKSVTVTTAGGTATKAGGFTYTAGDKIAGGNNNRGGVVAGKMKKPNDTSDGQLATSAAEETVVAVPMGVQLYLQTVITQPDADVDCANTQSSDANAPDATAGTVAAIDLDLNGEADICQLRRGDLDLNGVVDDADMSILLDMIGTEPLHGIGDLDGNGVIDSADMRLLLLKVK